MFTSTIHTLTVLFFLLPFLHSHIPCNRCASVCVYFLFHSRSHRFIFCGCACVFFIRICLYFNVMLLELNLSKRKLKCHQHPTFNIQNPTFNIYAHTVVIYTANYGQAANTLYKMKIFEENGNQIELYRERAIKRY